MIPVWIWSIYDSEVNNFDSTNSPAAKEFIMLKSSVFLSMPVHMPSFILIWFGSFSDFVTDTG